MKSTIKLLTLSISATILFATLMILASLDLQRAEASGMVTSAGNYTMVVGRMSGSTELVYVIDTRSEKLAVYRLNETSKTVEMTDLISLDEAGDTPTAPKNLKP
ncbi:MAG: hypothetical protein HJJLKODD_02658 [Phycisphaerae bacterium]|nr:hypothetical protein [Phycisphaerae bacterium]